MILDGKNVLVTGGTGSFGRQFVRTALENSPKKVIVFSRDELKQSEMSHDYGDPRLSFFIGDVRDRDRLYRAFDGVDYVVHAAALKQVPALEYNPLEAIKTNVMGASNVIDAAIDRGVKKVIALSTDKAVNPINLYGATKLCVEKLMVAGNSYAGGKETRFSVVRYGNVAASRGSVIPLFRQIAKNGKPFPITDLDMTRFWITLGEGVRFVLDCLGRMAGGEIFIPKLPSVKIVDLARAISPDHPLEVVGIRPGEKLHEVLVSESESKITFEYENYYEIHPIHHPWYAGNGNGGAALPACFFYSSDTNHHWLGVDQLKEVLCQI